MNIEEILLLIQNIATAVVPAITAIVAVVSLIKKARSDLSTTASEINSDMKVVKDELSSFKKEENLSKASITACFLLFRSLENDGLSFSRAETSRPGCR